MAIKLSDEDKRVLNVLGPVGTDGVSEGMFNYWYAEFGDDWLKTLNMLKSLKRRKLISSDGRGKWAQYWITKEGAIARDGGNDSP